jgi:LmbE family N-acetylglucosaminyl deacetylase
LEVAALDIGTVERPRVVLAVGAHPDDAEFACSGTLFKWAQQGCAIHYLVCTGGDKGSKDLAMTTARLVAIRQAEQKEAARRVGVQNVLFLGQPDGEFEPSLRNRERIATVIREVRPDVLMTHDPWRRYQLHPDHRAVGICTLDAMVAARDHLFFPHLFESGLAPHAVHEILLFGTDDANAWTDVSAVFDAKLHALRAHESQVAHLPDLEQRIHDRARLMGQAHGLDLAEEFHRIEV